MRNMDMILLTLILLFGESAGLWETEAVSVTGKLDEDVTIECSHFNARSNIKYFCKEPCSNEDVLIRSRGEGTVSKGRYRLRNEGNTFWVIISHLTEDDSGTYRCGIDRLGFDTYNKVILTVIKGDRKATGSDSSGSHSDKNINTNTAGPGDITESGSNSSVSLSNKTVNTDTAGPGDVEETGSDLSQSLSDKNINTDTARPGMLVYVGAGLGVVVLTLGVVLLIFFRQWTRGKEHNVIYEQHTRQTINSTSNEVGDADVRTNRSPILLAAHHQDNADDLFYSTVSFNKPTECSSVTPRPAESEYSTITHIPTDESTVYYNA